LNLLNGADTALFKFMEIKITPFLAKLILKFNPSRKVLVMCKGCGEDYDNFTELVRGDDKYLDFFDKETYPEYQLWTL